MNTDTHNFASATVREEGKYLSQQLATHCNTSNKTFTAYITTHQLYYTLHIPYSGQWKILMNLQTVTDLLKFYLISRKWCHYTSIECSIQTKHLSIFSLSNVSGKAIHQNLPPPIINAMQ